MQDVAQAQQRVPQHQHLDDIRCVSDGSKVCAKCGNIITALAYYLRSHDAKAGTVNVCMDCADRQSEILGGLVIAMTIIAVLLALLAFGQIIDVHWDDIKSIAILLGVL